MDAPFLGLAIVCLSGVAGGVFAFPLRMNKVYAEENTLLGAFVVAALVLPLLAATAILPGWPAVFRAVPARSLLLPFLLGIGWGMGSFCYAQGVSRIGIGLTVSTVMTLTMAVGAGIPLVSRWAGVDGTVRAWIVSGIAVCVTGVALFGVAGRRRDRAAATGAGARRAGGSLVAGFLWSLGSGLLSPLTNVGFDNARPVVETALRLGIDPHFSSLLGWFPVWAGGVTTLIVILGTRQLRRGTWRLYGARGSLKDLGRTLLMGLLHFLSQVPYGIGAYMMGTLGTSVGWAATLAFQLLTANVMGLLMGEWRGAPGSARRLLAAGMLVVLAAVAALAWGSSLPAG